MDQLSSSSNLTIVTTDIVAAYLTNNKVGVADIPVLIQSVHQTLSSIIAPAEPKAEEPPKATSAQIRKSISSEALISFEDGKPYKTLKRHLAKRGMTPEAYKTKWGLPSDYPTTSTGYSARRSEMAKSRGLGNRPRAEAPIAPKTVKKPKPSKTAKTAD